MHLNRSVSKQGGINKNILFINKFYNQFRSVAGHLQDKKIFFVYWLILLQTQNIN